MDQIARHIIFTGRVQGVGFRFTARDIASRHQITGFVRNLPDGTVEMVAQGYAEDVENCITDINDYFGHYIRKTDIQQYSYDHLYTDFRITF
jgi:acylphosphatase